MTCIALHHSPTSPLDALHGGPSSPELDDSQTEFQMYKLPDPQVGIQIEDTIDVQVLDRISDQEVTQFQLSPFERSHLLALQKVSSIFLDETDLTIVRESDNPCDLFQTYPYYLSKIIKYCKSIDAFKWLPSDDQVHLLKASHCHILAIRAAFTYDAHKDGYLLVDSERQGASLLVRLNLYTKCRNVENPTRSYRHILHLFNVEMDNDVFTRDLLMIMQLFKANDNILRPEFVRYQHSVYSYLLQQYLRIKYENETVAMTKWQTLLQIGEKLTLIKKIQYQMMADADCTNQLNDLIRELFGLN